MNSDVEMIEEDIPEIDWLSKPSTPEDVEAWFDYCQNMESRIEIQLEIIKDEIIDIKEILRNLKGGFEEMAKMKQSIMPFIIDGESYKLDTIFEKEGDAFVTLIPDLDIASQGDTIIDAYTNLKELTEFYFEGEDEDWIKKKLKYIKPHR